MIASPMLLWAQVLLLWTVAGYSFTIRDDPPRNWQWSLGAMLPTAVVLATLSRSAALVGLFVVCLAVLDALRIRWPAIRSAQRELAATIGFSGASWLLIVGTSLQLRTAAFYLPTTTGHIAVACLVAALFVFTIHGGNYLVRAALQASGVPAGVTEKEAKRGRWIGVLERGILFVVVIAGSYEALGFIVAAKGLIRSHEFDSASHRKDFTEYFLIGSLASVAVAVATGTIARYLIQVHW